MPPQTETRPAPGKKLLRVALPLLIIAAGCAAAAWLYTTRPEAPQRPVQRAAPRVEVVRAKAASERVIIRAMGRVLPAREVSLQARVSGRAVKIWPRFELGRVVSARAELVRIDPRDYRIALKQKQSDLQSARADLRQEQGQQNVARREWLMQTNASLDQAPDLALRRPQLKKARARVQQAEAAVERARLDLQRTTVKAPFEGLVTSKSVYLGTEIGTQDTLATLVGVDRFWVKASLPLDRIPWIQFAENSAAQASPVKAFSSSRKAVWHGRVLRLLGDLEPQGRMAQVLIEIPDPLGQDAGSGHSQRLLLSDFVRLEIQGRRIEGAVAIPRPALHNEGQVWVATEENTLDIRQVSVLWDNERKAYLDSGLKPGERVILTPLASPVQGMELQPAAADNQESLSAGD